MGLPIADCGLRIADWEARRIRGATLLEILMAMLVIALVAEGMLTAFVFSRRISWRAGSELSGVHLVREIADQLREVAAGTAPAGLTLAPGVYVDENMQNPPDPENANPARLAALNLPPEFRRFQTNLGSTNPPPFANHGDGRLYVVEDAPVDADGNGTIDKVELDAVDLDDDGLAGINFNNDAITDLRRVRVKLRWTTPES